MADYDFAALTAWPVSTFAFAVDFLFGLEGLGRMPAYSWSNFFSIDTLVVP